MPTTSTRPGRAPQDRQPAKKSPAKKAVQRKPTAGELEDGAARMSAASRAVAARNARGKNDGRPRVTTEGLAQEAAAEQPDRVELPTGCPRLRPLLELPRRERAEYLRALDTITTRAGQNKELQRLEGVDNPEDVLPSASIIRVTADIAEYAADIEDVLKVVAVDRDEFEAWAAKAPDDDLLQAFGWYQQNSSPGEA